MSTIMSSRRLAVIAAITAVITTPLFITGPATAATPAVGVVLAVQQDGTPDFEDGAPNPDQPGGAGLDAGPDNGIVRTYDTVVYRIDWNINEADATNVRVWAKLPHGMTWAALPSGCRVIDVTPTSAIAGDELMCNLGDRHQGENGTVSPVAKLGGLLNNTALTLDATITNDQGSIAISNAVTVRSSAAPKINVKKQLTVFGGPGDVPQVSGVENPITHEIGRVFYWPITIEVPGNGKGAEPLDPNQPLHLRDDLSAFTAIGTSVTYVDSSWTLPLPKQSNTTCGANDMAMMGAPFGRIGIAPTANASNSTVDSGTWTCSYDAMNKTIDIDITGADLAPASTPTGSSALPFGIGPAVLVSGVIATWVSDADLQGKLQTDIGGLWGTTSTPVNSIAWRSTPNGISGAPATGEDSSDDQHQTNYTYSQPGGPSAKYMGDLAHVQADGGYGLFHYFNPEVVYPTVPEYYPYVPTSPFADNSGVGTVTESQQFGIKLDYSNFGSDDRNQAACIQLSPGQTLRTIDHYLSIDYHAVGDYPAYANNIRPVVTTVGSDGPFAGKPVAATAIDLYHQFGGFAPEPQLAADQVVEYSTSPHSHEGQCGSTYTWSTTPPTDLSTVTQVRVHSPYGLKPQQGFLLYIALEALPQPIGSKIWFSMSSQLWASGDPFTEDTTWNTVSNGYDPAVFCDVPNGHSPSVGNNDCLTTTGPYLGITKAVTSARNAGLSDGDQVEYTIKASVVGASTAGTVANFVVNDSLPANLEFTGTSDPMPTNGAVAGDSTLEWDFGTVPVGTIKTITVQTRLKAGYAPFETLSNTATVDADYDTGSGIAPLDQKSSAAQIQASGTFASMEIQKATSTPLIDKNQPMTFTLSYANSGVEDDVSPTFIDVLPWNGDGRSTPTSYTGSISLASVVASGGEEIRYTNTAQTSINPDPDDTSNAVPGGSTKWCLASEFGTAGCPANIGASTAVWMRYPTDLHPGEHMNIDLHLNTTGNIANDVYANNFTGRAANIKLPVKSNTVVVHVRGVDLTILKTPPVGAVLGGQGDFTIAVTNHGPGDATNVELNDALPTGMTYITSSDSGVNTDGTVHWTIPSLRNGETKTVTITVRFDTAGTNQNTANITGVKEDERSKTDNTSTATLDIKGIDTTATTTTTTAAPPTSTPHGATPHTGNTPRGALPRTGTETQTVLWTALATLIAGMTLMIIGGKRRRRMLD